MVENLIAEFFGVIFTIFVLEEMMRRVERRNRKQHRLWEHNEKLRIETPIWEELDYTFSESLEEMARIWSPIMRQEDRLEGPPFYGGRLKEILQIDGLRSGTKTLPSVEYISGLAKKFLREGTHLYELYRMFPNLAGVTRYFIEMNNWLSTLRQNSQYLDDSQRYLLDAQQAGKDTEIKKFGKDLYFSRGAVEYNAWRIFVLTVKISEHISTKLNIPGDSIDLSDEGPPTWGELVMGVFRKLAKYAIRIVRRH